MGARAINVFVRCKNRAACSVGVNWIGQDPLERASAGVGGEIGTGGCHPTAGARFLFDNVYPEFDRYVDPMLLAQQIA